MYAGIEKRKKETELSARAQLGFVAPIKVQMTGRDLRVILSSYFPMLNAIKLIYRCEIGNPVFPD